MIGVGIPVDCIRGFSKSQRAESGSLIGDCDCPQSCHEFILGAITSAGSWPTNANHPQECEQIEANTNPNATHRFPTIDACLEWYSKNALVIQLNDALLTFGGQLGLWQGASTITMIEFVAFFIILVSYFWSKCWGPKRSDIPTDLDELDEVMKEGNSSDSGTVATDDVSSGSDIEDKDKCLAVFQGFFIIVSLIEVITEVIVAND